MTPSLLARARVIAKGSRIRDVQRLVQRYGGRVSGWVKKSSATFEIEGELFEYHWYEHAEIGKVEVKRKQVQPPMTVRLRRKNARYHDLTPNQPYVVIGIEGGDFRIINDAGRPYLYSPAVFQIVDPDEPEDWVSEFGEDGERYSYPAPLNAPGFFEDFFDHKPKAVRTFWRVVNRRLAGTAEVA